MIITAYEMAQIQRARKKGQVVRHNYVGGTITASEIAELIGAPVDTVTKRLRNESADEILRVGKRKRGYPAGRKINKQATAKGE